MRKPMIWWAPRLSRWGAAVWLAWALLAELAVAASAGPAVAHTPAAVTVLNPDLAGLEPLPGGGLLAWGSDASIWRHAADCGRKRFDGPRPGPRRVAARGHAARRSRAWHGRGGIVGRTRGRGRRRRRPVAAQRRPRSHLAGGHGAGRANAAIGPSAWGDDGDGALCARPGRSRLRRGAVRGCGRLTASLLSSPDAGVHWQPDLHETAPQGPLTGVAAAAGGGWWISSAAGQVWRGRPGAWQMRSLSSERSPMRVRVRAPVWLRVRARMRLPRRMRSSDPSTPSRPMPTAC